MATDAKSQEASLRGIVLEQDRILAELAHALNDTPESWTSERRDHFATRIDFIRSLSNVGLLGLSQPTSFSACSTPTVSPRISPRLFFAKRSPVRKSTDSFSKEKDKEICENRSSSPPLGLMNRCSSSPSSPSPPSPSLSPSPLSPSLSPSPSSSSPSFFSLSQQLQEKQTNQDKQEKEKQQSSVNATNGSAAGAVRRRHSWLHQTSYSSSSSSTISPRRLSSVQLHGLLGRSTHSVYKASLNGFAIACKILRHEDENDEEEELLTAISSFQHQNIARYLGWHRSSSDSGQLYLMMELFDFNLRSLLPFSDHNRLYSWTLQICNALVFLHQNNMAHTDVKSENVFGHQPGFTVKLGDLDGCLSFSSSPHPHGRGTLEFRAPELFLNKRAKLTLAQWKLADIWSFGMFVYELVSGQIPYRDEFNEANNESLYISMVETAIARGKRPLLPIGKEKQKNNKDEKDVMSLLVQVFVWCTESDATRRPASMSSIEEKLQVWRDKCIYTTNN